MPVAYPFEKEQKVKWLFAIVTLGAFAFSGFLVFLGMFGNKAALFFGIFGVAWKLILLFFGGWLYMWLWRYFGRRVVSGGGGISADPD